MGLLVVCANRHSPAKPNSCHTPCSSSQTQRWLWLHKLVTAEHKTLRLLVLAFLLTTQKAVNQLRELIHPENDLPEKKSLELWSWRRAVVARR